MARILPLRHVAVVLCSAACASAGYDVNEEFVDSQAPAYDEIEAMRMAALATAAYCDKGPVEEWTCGKACDHDQMEDAHVAWNESTKAFAVVGRFNGECAVGFRGSASMEQWTENVENVAQHPLEHCDPAGPWLPDKCWVGIGYLQGYRSIAAQVRQHLETIGCNADAGAELTLTGHSLGGVLAQIAAIDLAGRGWVPAKFYSFGQPRPGNAAFAKALWKKFLGKPFYRVTRKDDPVPHVPARDAPGEWVHSGREIYYKGSTEDNYKVCEKRLDGDPECAYDMTTGDVADKSTMCKIEPFEQCSHFKYLRPRIPFYTVDVDACDSSIQFTLI